MRGIFKKLFSFLQQFTLKNSHSLEVPFYFITALINPFFTRPYLQITQTNDKPLTKFSIISITCYINIFQNLCTFFILISNFNCLNIISLKTKKKYRKKGAFIREIKNLLLRVWMSQNISCNKSFYFKILAT